jgi:hypothetical protein
VIESHVLALGKQGSFLLGTDADSHQLNKVSVQCRAISECLQEASARGCWVLVLLDGLHDVDAEQLPLLARRNLFDWVRELVEVRKVMVLLASKEVASQRLTDYGAFTQAILESITVKGRTSNFSEDLTSPTLYDFKDAVIRGVERLTSAPHQVADFFPPDNITSDMINRTPIFERRTRDGVFLAKRAK